jgi:hypothetical protein
MGEKNIFVMFRHIHHFFEIKITRLITSKPSRWVLDLKMDIWHEY